MADRDFPRRSGRDPLFHLIDQILRRERRGRAMEEKKSLLREIVEQAGAELDYEVVDLLFTKEGSRRVLKVFIDRPGGITLKDCEVFSEHLGAVLDEKDPIPGSYLLEV